MSQARAEREKSRKKERTLCTENLPTTRDVINVLREAEVAFKATERNPPEQLDSQGEKLLQDLSNLTYDFSRFLEDKNRGDLLQKMAVEAELAGREIKEKGPGLKTPDRRTTREFREQSRNILSALRILAVEMVTSMSFRRDMEELLYILSCLVTDVSGVDFTRVTHPLHELMQSEGSGTAKEKWRQASEGMKITVKRLREYSNEREVRPLTAEEEDDLVNKLRAVMVRISERPDSSRFLRGLFDTISLFTQRYKLKEHADKARERLSANEHLVRMGDLLKLFFERFIGERTMKNLSERYCDLYHIAKKDRDVNDFLRKIRTFFMDNLEDPERWRTHPQVTTEAKEILQTARQLFRREDLRDSVRGVSRITLKALNNVANDPDLHALYRDSRQLITDLTMNEEGEYIFNSNALNQLRIVLVSALIERMTVQLPGISKETDKMDYTLSNVYVTLRDIVPESVKLKYKGFMDFATVDLKDVEVDDLHTLRVKLKSIQYHMTNIQFWFRKKTFPKIEDTGTVDVDLGGKGLSLKIELNTNAADGKDLFRVEKVKCKIDKLGVRLHETKHDILYNLAFKIWKGKIKKRLQRNIEEQIRDALTDLNSWGVDRSSHAKKLGTQRLQRQLGRLVRKYLVGDHGPRRYEYPTKFGDTTGSEKPVVRTDAELS